MSEIKSDCFAYNHNRNECCILNELICNRKKCSFYKHLSTINVKEIEHSINRPCPKNKT